MSARREVLIVDDEPAMLETLRDILEAEGFGVTVAGSGLEALEQARHQGFSLALLDYCMPGLNGIETLSQLKKICPDLEAVFVTAYAVPELSSLGNRPGQQRTLTKPLHVPSLLTLLQRMQGADVLLVDDDEALCSSLRDVLRTRGYRVALAHEGPKALDLAGANSYRTAIIDMRLPGMDGLELARRLKDLDRSLSVLLISGYPVQTESRVQRAVQEGLTFMCKPLDIDSLLGRLSGPWGRPGTEGKDAA